MCFVIVRFSFPWFLLSDQLNFTEIPDNDVGTAGEQHLRRSPPGHADDETEVAGATGLNSRNGVVDNNGSVGPDPQHPGYFEKGVGFRFSGDPSFRRAVSIHLGLEQVLNPDGREDRLAIGARTNDGDALAVIGQPADEIDRGLENQRNSRLNISL
jgi:hypothetical protein